MEKRLETTQGVLWREDFPLQLLRLAFLMSNIPRDVPGPC